MTDQPIRVLVLGASGMLGNAILRFFAQSPGYTAIGALRSARPADALGKTGAALITGLNAENSDSLAEILVRARPDIVINCVGLIKQLGNAGDVLAAVPINALLPNRLVQLTALTNARLVHVSTDCVFAGIRGGYTEDDAADARDVYGLSKYLGEVDAPHAITLRTSIIGHEMQSANGLIEWFLSQSGSVKGFTKVIFSGLPTVELARVMRDHVLPNPALRGLYHVSAEPISKCDLLRQVREEYGVKIEIEPAATPVIDRSLDSSRFRKATGYEPPAWKDLIRMMKDFG